jgi:potassium-dependent mechanosensitive channel
MSQVEKTDLKRYIKEAEWYQVLNKSIYTNDYFSFSFLDLMITAAVFFVGLFIARKLSATIAKRVSERSHQDKDFQLWLKRFLSFIFMIPVVFLTMLQAGVKMSLFHTIWTFPLYEIQNSVIELGNLILALVLLFPGIKLSNFLAGEFDQVFLSRSQIETASRAAITLLVRIFLIIGVVFFVLSIIGIPLAAFTVVGGALAIGLGLGSQNLVNNFLSGLILMSERPLKPGDIVELNDLRGTVEQIGMRSTRIRTFDNLRIVVPNSHLLENNIINWSLEDTLLRRELVVGIAYGSPTRLAEKLLLQATDDNPLIEKTPEPFVIFDDFGNDALIFKLYYYIDIIKVEKPLLIGSNLRFQIDELYREAKISIAFPQRDVHLDSSSPVKVQILKEK